jgi:hypothetical protein
MAKRMSGSVADPVMRGAGSGPIAGPVLHIYRSVSAHAAVPVSHGAIRARDGLLFAYSNGDPTLDHLMVFAIDSSYNVHWYYPAYERAGQDPEAVPILPGTVGTELGEEIRHGFPPGQVRVYALFLSGTRHVLEIEAMVRKMIEEPGRPATEEARFPIAGAVQQSELLEVEP